MSALDRISELQLSDSRENGCGRDVKDLQPSHRVANDLRGDVIAGVLAPGTWLKTEELARRYSVSANPVREALWKLQGEGFVVANPNQGARVRVIDDDFVRNIFQTAHFTASSTRAM